ncbi:hypothetical protein [Jhaorihella thermophila]|uniref:Uncharacterized protein n=1 Tax=Jhaorihella thermophila TaxID=488547 RepID=A0A1H5TFA7_9RHOB|nr:hypothetical protein [Jhaorihella thermophila]SEF60898.1 hypothetical protein SAMN05421751_102219 [Jhaorihella thermophila]
MTSPALAALLLLSASFLNACDALPVANEQPTKTVTVMGREWAVVQVGEEPATWKAVRDNNGLNPFGRPAASRTLQATRAINAATGCRVVRSTMYQTDTGAFYVQVACN